MAALVSSPAAVADKGSRSLYTRTPRCITHTHAAAAAFIVKSKPKDFTSGSRLNYFPSLFLLLPSRATSYNHPASETISCLFSPVVTLSHRQAHSHLAHRLTLTRAHSHTHTHLPTQRYEPWPPIDELVAAAHSTRLPVAHQLLPFNAFSRSPVG